MKGAGSVHALWAVNGWYPDCGGKVPTA